MYRIAAGSRNRRERWQYALGGSVIRLREHGEHRLELAKHLAVDGHVGLDLQQRRARAGAEEGRQRSFQAGSVGRMEVVQAVVGGGALGGQRLGRQEKGLRAARPAGGWGRR